jgi:hypothetical protein
LSSRGVVAIAACAFSLAAVLAGCGGSNSSPVVNGTGKGVCGGQTGVASGQTPSYVVVLVVQPLSDAVTGSSPTAAVSPTPTTPAGDNVISGSLANVSGPGAAHVEFYICDRSTGGIASRLHPAVTLRNDSADVSPDTLPVAVLERSGQGVNDLHYGNNVSMEPGANYTISVRIDSSNAIDLAYQVPDTGVVVTPGVPQCLLNHQMCG